ncbi:Uncharacterised protein [Chromobacterium violaceum]|uniref:Uncharacterized protein n=1 Tax=Chromobacterium violaceum TaxID=536 RepID=A0A447TJK0_CHRVL|nr:Uncharacterised protein [Chromobacterium violaceum]
MGALAAVSGRELQVRTLEYEAGRLKLQVPRCRRKAWPLAQAAGARQIMLDATSSQPAASN